jgi:beta-glucuronidase
LASTRSWAAGSSALAAALAALALPAAARAEARLTPLGFVEARGGQSLDGDWHVIVDPYENGFYDYRQQPRPNGYFKNEKPRSPSDLVEYDFDRSPVLRVPGDWNTQRADLSYYEGTVWYEKTFDHDVHAAGGRTFLRFGAAAARAIVWLNGERLGEHEGGFTPFAFEVTGRLKPRGNFVVVKVDNTRRREAIPTVNTDWWNYGGLTRGVRLVETPAVFVRDAAVQLSRDKTGEVAGWVQVDGARGPTAVTVEIPDAHARGAATTDAAGRAAFHFPAELARWSPERPTLHDVTITAAGGDRVREAIGFRTIEARGHDILLNGKPIFLRGISAHEEALRADGRGGRATSRADDEALLALAKQLGCNFVRLAHYPHNDEMTRAADRLGLLVWSEIPVYWTIAWENPDTLADARHQLAEMIARDRNRASVILWSVANETPVTASRTRFLRTLVDDARAQDPSRLLTAALEHHYVDARTVMLDDPLGAALDVIGLNEYVGWYDGLPDKCDGITFATAYDKPLVVSEFGADAKAGLHGDARARFTEEYQADLYRRQIAMLQRMATLRGMSPWILVDFRSPRRPLPGVQDGWNRKGLVSSTGEKKQAFSVLQSFYAKLAAEQAARDR